MAVVSPLAPELLHPPLPAGVFPAAPSNTILAPGAVLDVIRRALAAKGPGHHLYIAGLEEPGALERARDLVERLAPPADRRKDRVLVADPRVGARARLVELRPGTAHRFREHVVDIGEKLEAGAELAEAATELVVRYPGAAAWLTALAKETSRPVRKERFQVAVLHTARRTRTVVVPHPSAGALLGDASGPNLADIHGGALEDAYGGILVVRAADLVQDPETWKAFLRTLVHGRHAIGARNEGAHERFRVDPLTIAVKVVLVGTPVLYAQLHESDNDFRALFTEKAELDLVQPFTTDVVRELAGWAAAVVERRALPPLTKEGFEALLGWAIREGGRGGRIQVAPLAFEALLVEAGTAGDWIDRGAIQGALERRSAQKNQMELRVRESLVSGFLHVDTAGSVVGQVNGLAVYRTAGHKFARPLRVTCSVGTGKGGFVNIEREAGLSGKSHDKGVQVIAGFLRSRFGRTRTLQLTASLCFEQSYGTIDGDSASVAELLALLSALAHAPLAQGRAVTGSVDQHGNVQTIGSVNDKIEGFFHLCAARGLDGEQGVVIPARNALDLRLADEVVLACRDLRFHVWPVERIEDALALLSPIEVGDPGATTWPRETLYGSVVHALAELEATARRASKGEKG
jgi:predicted ATP-dependent protease